MVKKRGIQYSEEMQALFDHLEDVIQTVEEKFEKNLQAKFDPLKIEIDKLVETVNRSTDKLSNHDSVLAVINEKILNDRTNRENADNNIEKKLDNAMSGCLKRDDSLKEEFKGDQDKLEKEIAATFLNRDNRYDKQNNRDRWIIGIVIALASIANKFL